MTQVSPKYHPKNTIYLLMCNEGHDKLFSKIRSYWFKETGIINININTVGAVAHTSNV
jgi:hypothetical protein